MKKNVRLGLIIVLGLGLLFYFFTTNNLEKDLTQTVVSQTNDISRQYLALRYRTDNLLLQADSYEDYDAWQKDFNSIVNSWKTLEAQSKNLEKSALEMSESDLSFNFINSALAYSPQEISDVFDKAPAGKKIATLAKFLGVDAKTAYNTLQNQATMEADKWNKRGDNFQVLESTATVIKDACKVTGFVGTIALTGGTAAIAAGSTLAQAAVIVSGADLVLEVTDDAAKIALGNHNKVSSIVGDVRVVTEPASAILMISSLPNNIATGIDKLNLVSFGLDQFNSSVQEGKAIGIKLPAYTGAKTQQNAQVSILEKSEIQTWLSEQAGPTAEDSVTEIEELLQLNQSEEAAELNEEKTEVVDEKNILTTSDNETAVINSGEVAGIWEGVLSYTPSQSSASEEMSFIVNLLADGKVENKDNGESFSTWEQNGNLVRLFSRADEGEGYYEFSHSGDTLTFVKSAGLNSEGEWQEDFAGEDFFGGTYYQITLQRQ